MIIGNNLTKTFNKIPAVDNIDLKIDSSCVYGLVGSNGSGKSTLLRMISGVYNVDGGMLLIDGETVFDNPEIKDKISFLGDTPYFLPQSNLNDMMRFYSSLYNNFDINVFEHFQSVFPLDSKARLSSFSKGMQRQAALMLCLSSHPSYVLLDEAFDGLDVVMRNVLKQIIIDSVEKEGITVIIASHNLRELEDMCDHIGLMHRGKLLVNGEVDDLRDNIHKVQVVFKNEPDEKMFEKFDIIKKTKTGSLYNLIVRGNKENIVENIESLLPVFSEFLEPTLEEMFIYELEAKNYDVKNILK